MPKNEIEINKQHWDCRSDYHVQQGKASASAAAYGINEFLSGRNMLRPCDLQVLKNVKDKKLLHLQCHIGLDTLSWARLGAKVTGVDLSGKAVQYAQELASLSHLKATFIESDVYELPSVLKGKFDIVYTSRGVLMWLPDLDKWATVVKRFLKPEGVLFLHEEHPITDCFEPIEIRENINLVAQHDYFQNGAVAYESGTYTNRKAVLKQPKNFQWHHKLGDVVTSLAKAGLIIDELKELKEGFYRRYPQQTASDDTYWCLPQELSLLPLSFFIKAHKPKTKG